MQAINNTSTLHPRVQSLEQRSAQRVLSSIFDECSTEEALSRSVMFINNLLLQRSELREQLNREGVLPVC